MNNFKTVKATDMKLTMNMETDVFLTFRKIQKVLFKNKNKILKKHKKL